MIFSRKGYSEEKLSVPECEELISIYNFKISEIGNWEVYGSTSDSEQCACCDVEVIISKGQEGPRYQFSCKVSARRQKEIFQLFGKNYWQIGLELIGGFLHEAASYEDRL